MQLHVVLNTCWQELKKKKRQKELHVDITGNPAYTEWLSNSTIKVMFIVSKWNEDLLTLFENGRRHKTVTLIWIWKQLF